MSETQKHILVIEDEKPLLQAVSRKLEHEGFRVTTVTSAEEALEKLTKGEQFDLVWLDVLLPGMDGVAFLREVRAEDELKHMPVIVVSNFGTEEVVASFADLETTAFFVKAEHRLADIVINVQTILNGFGPAVSVL